MERLMRTTETKLQEMMVEAREKALIHKRRKKEEYHEAVRSRVAAHLTGIDAKVVSCVASRMVATIIEKGRIGSMIFQIRKNRKRVERKSKQDKEEDQKLSLLKNVPLTIRDLMDLRVGPLERDLQTFREAFEGNPETRNQSPKKSSGKKIRKSRKSGKSKSKNSSTRNSSARKSRDSGQNKSRNSGQNNSKNVPTNNRSRSTSFGETQTGRDNQTREPNQTPQPNKSRKSRGTPNQRSNNPSMRSKPTQTQARGSSPPKASEHNVAGTRGRGVGRPNGRRSRPTGRSGSSDRGRGNSRGRGRGRGRSARR